MASMTHDGPEITGGVDTHGLTHHAAVIDPVGRHLPDREFAATIRGYRDLLGWMPSYGTLIAVGVHRRLRRRARAGPGRSRRCGCSGLHAAVRSRPTPRR
ncbi:hypothetical protein [Streptomyces anulatus]|uniref:hypothetical protein n=1 Tax=Streptomyces anulatus TaxID=1892 RepID=UPI003683425F